MPSLCSLATAIPPHQVHQAEARQFAHAHFAAAFPNITAYLPVFEHAEVETRSLVVPPEWFLQPHTFQACNDLFITWATRLGEEVIHRCLEQAGLTPHDVDHLIVVSTTGLAAPGIDAHLFNRLGMRPHTRRTPVWGLGCAGGVAGLSRAYEYTLAFPHHRALLLCVELCSITFQWDDHSKRNLVATALFSDGAAAVLVSGNDVPQETTHASPPAPRILGTRSTFFPDTLDVMGWDIVESGMKVVFSSRIPQMVQEFLLSNVSDFLADYGIGIDHISQFILHPGGAKIIRAYARALGVEMGQLAHVQDVLRRYGNMSSPTVFFVYQAFQDQTPLKPGDYGLMIVLGPGFSCEMALIQG